jgi:putative ABC transport system permease protein
VNLRETMRTSWEGIVSHRLRSVLTMVGILIGVAAVILTVGLGQGAQAQVAASIDKLGSNLLVVSPGSATTTTGVRGGRGTASTLTLRDATALADPTVAPDVSAVAPVASASLALTAGTSSWTTSVVGTTPSWEGVRSRTLSSGRFLTQADLDQGNLVVVLGTTTATQLFGARDPVGQTLTVGPSTVTVVGELTSIGSSPTADEDDQAIVPQTTFASRLATTANRSTLTAIFVQGASQAALPAAYQETDQALLTLHRVTTATTDFSIASQQSLLQTATSTDRTLTVLLAGVAGISLLVGGLGVMNIMLVSVTERIREIGLRKALGATPSAVRRQFLAEAGTLGLGGGVLGVLLGVVGAVTLPRFLGQPVTLSVLAAAGAVAISLVIGLVAGVYPASRAARLAPIDALRSD